MNRAIVIDVFAEDRAHEEFLRPLLRRIAEDEKLTVEVRVRSGRGGHSRAIAEFQLYQRLVENNAAERPDLVVVGIDGNCTTFAKKKRAIFEAATPTFQHRLVAACPDPHVERWYLADPVSFKQVVHHRPIIGKKKCKRDAYKKALSDAIRQGGNPPTLSGIEFASELVSAMDLYRAARNDRSLGAFVDDLRGKLRDLRAE